MNVEILGQYDFDNFTLLNALMSESECINTAIHEYTHFVLSNQSVYGTILYCLKKLSIPYDCKIDRDKQEAAMNFFLAEHWKFKKEWQSLLKLYIFCLEIKRSMIALLMSYNEIMTNIISI